MTTKAELEIRIAQNQVLIAELETTVYEQRRAIARMNADLDHWKESQLQESDTRRRRDRTIMRRIDRLALDPDYLAAAER